MNPRRTGKGSGLPAAFLMVVTLLSACGDASSSKATVAGTGGAAAVVRIRGAVMVRPDSAMVFVACGTTAERPVVAPASSRLAIALEAVNGALRDSAYVDLSADTTGGRVTVRETHLATSFAEGPLCDRPRAVLDWDAKGNEPFWRVTVDSTQVVLERPEPPRELVFELKTSQTYGTLTTIIATRALGRAHELKLGLLRESCRDGMSDAWYPYRAEVRIADVAMHGCATR